MHDYHPAHPMYSPNQVLHDGCRECEDRGKSLCRFLAHADRDTFVRAWERAKHYYDLKDLGMNESKVLLELLAVQQKLKETILPNLELSFLC